MTSLEKGRLSRLALIVLLVFGVSLIIHTHVNTTDATEDLLQNSKLPSKKPFVHRIEAPQTKIPSFRLQETLPQGEQPSDHSPDVNSIISMFDPSMHAPESSHNHTESYQNLPTLNENATIQHVEEQLSIPLTILNSVSVNNTTPQSHGPDSSASSPSDSSNANLTKRTLRPSSLDGSSGDTGQRISFMDSPTAVKAQQAASSLLTQTLSFLDPVLHGSQKKGANNDAARAVEITATTAPSKKTHTDGHISFLNSESEAVLQQTNPEKLRKKKKTAHSEQKQDSDLARIVAENNHPNISPRRGTDISPENHMSVLLCPNQSKCIVPEIQLQKKLKIYFCKHPTRHGVRFYYLAREGLLLHPNVELVTEPNISTADFIVYLPGSAPWHLTECNNASFAKKLIVLDEFDGHTLFNPGYKPDKYAEVYGGTAVPWYYMYFKRSFVRRTDGVFGGYPHLHQWNVYPLTYSLAQAYIPHHFNTKREIEILCTLRGSKAMSTRLRVQTWVAEYGKEKQIQNIVTGEVNTATRTTVSKQYFEQMYNAQIIVTVNPANWEGDFRLWEAMSTGALVFVDPVFVPHPYPLKDKEHVIFFSNKDREDLFRKLDYYRANPVEARKIAVQGYLHAMKFHRTVNMVDYILRTAHIKQATLEEHQAHWPQYTFTGQYLNYEAGLQEKAIKACHTPGIYEPPLHPSDAVKRLAECAVVPALQSNADGRFHLQQ